MTEIKEGKKYQMKRNVVRQVLRIAEGQHGVMVHWLQVTGKYKGREGVEELKRFSNAAVGEYPE